MISNSTTHSASNSNAQPGGGLNSVDSALWLDRSIESALVFGTAIPDNSINTTGLHPNNTRNLFNPDASPPEPVAPQNLKPIAQQETPDASEPQPPTGAECSICLADFQSDPKAALLPECETPTWIHDECLSQHTQHRIADPITKDELNGIGIACPTCDSSKQHTIPVNQITRQISSVECLRKLQGFHQQSQRRIYARDPFSPLLDVVVTKNATCPDCQQRYFVNLRDPEQAEITCSGQIHRRNVGVVPCLRRFCAGCEEMPHSGMSCYEANVRLTTQKLSDLHAKLEVYQMAKRNDRQFRPCPKCDNLIQKTGGCYNIQQTGLHADENVPADASNCDHNICFECLKDWEFALYSNIRAPFDFPDDHDFYHCNDPSNRKRLYARKIAEIKQEIQILGGTPKKLPKTGLRKLFNCFSGNKSSADN